jgi:hypothetical protein
MPATRLRAILTTLCMGADAYALSPWRAMKIEYRPIGVIHSPFTELEGMPIQQFSRSP